MEGAVAAAARALRVAVASFDPAVLSGADCAAVASELALTEKACALARVRAARRAATCDAHRAEGFSDPAEWLARRAGTSVPQARADLETASALDAVPDTRAAAERGELSLAQAGEIARAEAVAPGAEAGLLALARTGSLRRLRDGARAARLAAVDPHDLYARQHDARSVRHWRDELGMVRLEATLAPDVGVALVNRLDTETDRVRRRAVAAGRRERREAHAADALVAMTASDGTAPVRRADVVIVCDLRAWRRGHTHPGEVCHLVGGGPLPVPVMRDLATDAFLKVVVHDGVAIHTVAHLGRHIPAELRTALDLGPLPALDGVTCSEQGCDRRHGLEWDHVIPFVAGGPTSWDNLTPRCWPHHQAKTRRDRASGWSGSTPGPAPPRPSPP